MTIDPITALTGTIDNATKVANTPLFTTVIDRILGFKISQWSAEGEIRKQQIIDGYEEAKKNGLAIQYISGYRSNVNLINTGIKSAKYIDNSKENDIKMDNDFFWGLIKHAEEISDDEMQEFIAKIIAGEYNQPGQYSMRTLQTIKMLGKNELELFEKISGLLINKRQIPEKFFGLNDENIKSIWSELKIDYESLQTLQSFGLFYSDSMTRQIPNPEKKVFMVSYFNESIRFELVNKENSMVVELEGFYQLTPTGEQILRHLNQKFNKNYFDWLKKNYIIQGYKIIETD